MQKGKQSRTDKLKHFSLVKELTREVEEGVKRGTEHKKIESTLGEIIQKRYEK